MTNLPGPPHGRCGAHVFADSLVVAGGGPMGSRVSDVFLLDLGSRHWLQLPSLNVVRGRPSLIGKLVCVGGYSNNGEGLSIVEVLDLNV